MSKFIKFALVFATVFAAYSSPNAATTDLVVLIPGAGSSAEKISIPSRVPFSKYFNGQEYFAAYEQKIRALGFATKICPSLEHQDRASLDERTFACETELAQENICSNYGRAYFVGHSMGGLVAQRIQEAGRFTCLQSALAIASPFYGSDLADVVVREESTNSVIGKLLRYFTYTSDRHLYISEMSRAALKNKSYSENQKFYSLLTYEKAKQASLLSATKKILANEILRAEPNRKTENDGIVPTESMRLGTVLGKVQANHMESGCFGFFQKTNGCRLVLGKIEKWLKEVSKPTP